MDSQLHNNLWAERLQQVSLPDSGGAWLAMEALLDREGPHQARKDWRRWVLLILFLLLLIGVCHCPGTGRLNRNDRPGTRSSAVIPPAHPAAADPAPVKGSSVSMQYPPTAPSHLRSPLPEKRHASTKKTPFPIADAEEDLTLGTNANGYHKNGTGDPPGTTPRHVKNDARKSNPLHQPKSTDSSRTSKTYQRPTPPPHADSVRKKTPPPADPKNKDTKQKGWMAGIGLNQFFPLGGQQSPYNSSGIAGSISDYIPVPMLRYYFNPKLYLQLEAQFNTPQAAKKDLVISSPPKDSLPATLQFVQHTTSIQQLFYFNVPLSIHYMPREDLNIGAGIQFSHLTNAIGGFDSSTWNIYGTPDTVNVKAVKSLKGDPLYQTIKTNEFRLLLDAGYTYKRFIFGIRYNQALSPFVRIQIAPGQITQSRNSSLQLYLRYILWDGRR